jgi:hypothetical protein
MPQSPKWWSIPLVVAGVHSCILASYHFVLPFHMGWARGLEGVPDSLVWALFALNFSWSALVFLTGVLAIRAGRIGPGERFVRLTVFTIGLFWAIHGVYTWIQPLPLPRSLQVLKLVLWAFPLVVVALHWLPLLRYRRGLAVVPPPRHEAVAS